jgi:hypothetical protein
MATAWTGGGTEREVAEVLLVAAAAGLLLLRRREDLAPLLGPPVAVPVLAGVLAGESVAASLAELGTPGTTIAGYAGILTAAVVPEVLPARLRVPYAALARAAGGTAAVLALAQLGGWQHWTALCVLFLLTAAPTAVVALRQPD